MGAGTSLSATRTSSIPEVVTEADAKTIVGPRWPALKPHFLESLAGGTDMPKSDFLAFIVDTACNHLDGGRGDTVDEGTCIVRIIHVNDVYDLGALPHLKTLVDKWALPQGHKTIVTCGGDFLAPSLLSGLDHGAGMVDCLNALPTDFVCFGNHECDVPHASLLERIEEFQGTWLNTNMPEITTPPLPAYDIVKLSSKDGTHVRRLGLIGLLCGYPALYRPGAFNGKVGTIQDPQKAALRAAELLRVQKADALIPLTHLDQKDDEKLAEALTHAPLPVPAILGGHDHGTTVTQVNDTKVAKAGMDAVQAVILDLVWASKDDAAPQTRCLMEPVDSYPPDPEMEKRVEKHMAKVKALDNMILQRLDSPLSSEGTPACAVLFRVELFVRNRAHRL
jgi:2',3'-cyclic-nucleotide 2'-phosphodiesterase (5'-nucleotidase family)